MKKSILILTLLFIAIIGHTQTEEDDVDTRELLITTNSFSNGYYGLQYKTKISDKTFMRLGIANLYHRTDSRRVDVTTNFYHTITDSKSGFSIMAGLEKRKALSELFQFTYGINLIISGALSTYTDESFNSTGSTDKDVTKGKAISPAIGVNFGAIMKIYKDFYLGAEIIPQLSYTHQVDTDSADRKQITNGFGVSISSQGATVALIYRFE